MGDFDCWRQKLLGLRSRSIAIRDSRLGLDASAGTASDPRPTPEPLFFPHNVGEVRGALETIRVGDADCLQELVDRKLETSPSRARDVANG
jgi:hypothetical protein